MMLYIVRILAPTQRLNKAMLMYYQPTNTKPMTTLLHAMELNDYLTLFKIFLQYS